MCRRQAHPFREDTPAGEEWGGGEILAMGGGRELWVAGFSGDGQVGGAAQQEVRSTLVRSGRHEEARDGRRMRWPNDEEGCRTRTTRSRISQAWCK